MQPSNYKPSLVNYLNESTKFCRYRHSQKLKEKYSQSQLLQYQKIFASKDSQKEDIQTILISIGDSIAKLSNVLYQQTNSRLKISIETPSFFHLPPDPILPEEELIFKS